MIVFIDTKVNPQTKRVADYGAVREDGAVLHSHSKADFDAFVSKCDTVCGHNIINHDLKYTALRGNPTIIDTLYLSPLLFPKRPYHHLVKDDKLQVDELNNPVNDSMKARDLLNDEVTAWNQLPSDKQAIYYQLLHETDQFKGFFKYIGYTSTFQQSLLGRFLRVQPDWGQLILKEFDGKVCSHANFDTLVRQYPIELAYCLSVIGADDIFSITPAWVIRNYPDVGEYANLMVRDYDAALRFVNDYFTMDFRKFIGQYFTEDNGEHQLSRRAQIDQNITPAKYNKLFGELSNRQCEIIDDKESKYIVVAAGPGSGKTRVLVHKLASLLLLEDVKHEQLLMLTFSRAAATEFKKRLIDLVGNAAHYVEIKTFHSYSFDIVGKQGNLDEAKDVVRRAAEMIENGEEEQSKIAKSVLVIDEAQDMGADDFRLVQALMRQNKEMRVIAVGDDDQNIYAFRGSDSRYMQSLISQEGAKLYEMTDNYRSAKAVVDCANRFVQRIPGRLKKTPIQSATGEEGKVLTLKAASKREQSQTCLSFAEREQARPKVKSLLDAEIKVQGNTAILTRTNEETMQVAYELEQRGLHATVAQSMGGFRFGNLAEVRYFLKLLGRNEISISKEKWQEAKQRTLETYASSTCLSVMKHFFADFEATRQVYYRSDLRDFIFESNIEDFIAADDKSVFVSTIHKAKGREFDTVYLLSPVPDGRDVNDMRAYYVGLTRAKRNLFLVTNPPVQYSSISIALNMRDVWLDFFKGRKDVVLRLRGGDSLQYQDGYLLNNQGINIIALSASGKDKLKAWTDKGYEVTIAKVSYTLAWKPQDSETEYAVCLANVVLSKIIEKKEL